MSGFYLKAKTTWLPEFETIEYWVVGDEWPSFLVEKWVRNGIGERRFTGEHRTYHSAPTPNLSQEPERMAP